jgi:hypothetical protein
MSRNVMRLNHVRGNLLCSGTGAGVTFVHFDVNRENDRYTRQREVVGAFQRGLTGRGRSPRGSRLRGRAGAQPQARQAAHHQHTVTQSH